jgi:23S rRNA U2552 (ribose-2'-O)-methylase RlmE/FtsJ
MIVNSARRLYRQIFPSTSATPVSPISWYDGVNFTDQYTPDLVSPPPADIRPERSPLEAFFDAKLEGPGIWKWRHYFDIYHRHFSPIRNRDHLVILEIGIYSGGSLDMWREYFGPTAKIYGVDIEPSCRTYERPGTHILIGDQADRTFWQRMIADGTLPAPDIVIDDGGHTPEQQRVTLEELLPHLRPGGVYLCEDIQGQSNDFAAFVSGLSDSLNAVESWSSDEANPERRVVVKSNSVQASLNSVHLYPYVVVIEKRDSELPELVAPKHGSQWEPFLR